MLFRKRKNSSSRALRKSSAVSSRTRSTQRKRVKRSLAHATSKKKSIKNVKKHPTKRRTRRRHRHDLALSNPTYNPFTQVHPKKYIARFLLRLLLFSAFLFLSYEFLTHPTLQISQIVITGTKGTNSSDITQTINSILDGERLGLFSARHYAFVPLGEVSTILKDKYPIESIELKKQFPNVLSISIREQISSIIYDNTRAYYLIEKNGNVVKTLRNVAPYEWQISSINTTTEFLTQKKSYHVPDTNSFSKEYNGLPVLVDSREEKFEEDINSGMINEMIISSTLNWQKVFEKNNIDFSYISITDPRAQQAIIHDWQGRTYLVSFDGSSSTQVAKIHAILSEHPTASRIDVRFPGRVYWE